MLLKYFLIGLGGTAVVGGGGYMIYNATKSGNENQEEEEGETQSPKAPTDSALQRTQ